jgi:hypothetical protein
MNPNWLAISLVLFPFYASAGNSKGSAKGPELSEKEVVEGCVKLHEQSFACKEQFVDMLLAMRAKTDDDVVEALNDPKMHAELRQKAMSELEDEGSGPLGPRQARCQKAAKMGMHILQSDSDALNACYAKDNCDEKVSCLQPLIDRLMPKPHGSKASKH